MPRKNSEQEIKGLSLYFMQARGMLLESLDWLEFLQRVPKLKDDDILTQVKTLAAAYKNPKLSIVTRSYYLDGEMEGKNAGDVKDVKHNEIPLYKAADRNLPEGAYEFFIPDIYKRDPASKYLIGGTVWEVEQYRVEDYLAWKTYAWDNELTVLTAEQKEANLEVQALNPSDKEKENTRKNRRQQEKNLGELQVRYDSELFNFDTDFETSQKYLANLTGRIALTIEAIKEMDAKIKAWDDGSFTKATEVKVRPLVKKFEAITEKVFRIYAVFAHEKATELGIIKEAFEPWYEELDEIDKTNVMLWCVEGNALRTPGQGVGPMTREQERELELKRAVN